ncbi:PTS sugar transporter subunit IIA [Zhihengliuella sp.]|uniref:PTS sugar transporter subunit IIA n=1 Tax=Zhihengliuella sp. TaxID=1954483 RepID=UPI0028116D2A|nr:PTS sugar transporter subunit IIA [Zhihengliuella sp.]
MPSLRELITEEAIALDAPAADWEDAVRAAGRLLEEQGVCTEVYTQSMVDNVVENGPYIVVAPGFAFAHARPSEAVLRTGMSWVRLAEPVTFGHEKHDPVTLVVALAAQDSKTHTRAMAELARILGSSEKRAAVDAAESPRQILDVLDGAGPTPSSAAGGAQAAAGGAAATSGTGPEAPASNVEAAATGSEAPGAGSGGEDRHLILTVCGNGLGTSLFLKNTLEQVLDRWGWSRHVTVEATDTISARGRAHEAAAILTSGEIAKILGDVGRPVRIVENFTSTDELDAALRELYDV